MMSFMDELKEKANVVAKTIGKKTGEISKKTEEVVEIQKLKSQVRALEQNNEVDLCDMGEIIYAKYLEGQETDSDLAGICDDIKKRLITIKELEREVMIRKGQKICDACNETVDKEAVYCDKCGAKMPEPEVEEEAATEEEPVFEEGDIIESVVTEDEEVEIELVVEES